jgi:hypothetical protein
MPYIGNTPALDYISYAVQNFTVTAGTTVYTLDYSVANENDIRLVINNVIQRPGVSYAYSATGTTLTLTSATLATDTMYAVFIGRAVQTVTPPANINIQLADGTAAAPSLNFANDTNTGIFRPTTDTIAFTEGGTEAMRIDSSGNLGVGTTNPSPKITVARTATTTVTNASYYLGLGGTENLLDSKRLIGMGFSSGSTEEYPTAMGYVETNNGGYTNGAIAFYTRSVTTNTAPSERMRINSSGAVMINTTANDLGKLNVSGSIYLFDLGSGAGSSTLKYDHLSTGRVTFDTSSRLVKENIENSPYGLNEILQLQPRKYFRKDDQRNEIGLIADEVVDILPEFVPIGQKKLITENKEDIELIPVGVNYEKLTAVLIKGIQEQQAIIEELKARLTALENN